MDVGNVSDNVEQILNDSGTWKEGSSETTSFQPSGWSDDQNMYANGKIGSDVPSDGTVVIPLNELYALKGKAKGKGKPFNGNCHLCGQWGHRMSSCPQAKGKAKSKGKGKKGKGKGKGGKGKGGLNSMDLGDA